MYLDPSDLTYGIMDSTPAWVLAQTGQPYIVTWAECYVKLIWQDIEDEVFRNMGLL